MLTSTRTLFNTLAGNIRALHKRHNNITPNSYILKAKENFEMTVTTTKRVESLEEEIKGLQAAIRQQAQEHAQALSVLSKTRNDVEVAQRRLERLELLADKDKVGGVELY